MGCRCSGDGKMTRRTWNEWNGTGSLFAFVRLSLQHGTKCYDKINKSVVIRFWRLSNSFRWVLIAWIWWLERHLRIGLVWWSMDRHYATYDSTRSSGAHQRVVLQVSQYKFWTCSLSTTNEKTHHSWGAWTHLICVINTFLPISWLQESSNYSNACF